MSAGVKFFVWAVLGAIALLLLFVSFFFPFAFVFFLFYSLFVFLLSFRFIYQYQSGVIFTLGRLSGTRGAGWTFITPFVDDLRVIDIRILTFDIPSQQVITKDNVPVTINGVVYFKVDTIPYNVVFELREEDTAYKEKYSLPGLLTKYKYFTICNKEDVGCQTSADFYIEKDRVFLFRAMFNQTSRYGKLEYSNEHIIDTTAGSEYLTETCAKR